MAGIQLQLAAQKTITASLSEGDAGLSAFSQPGNLGDPHPSRGAERSDSLAMACQDTATKRLQAHKVER